VPIAVLHIAGYVKDFFGPALPTRMSGQDGSSWGYSSRRGDGD
jgi:hypothetical protein